MNSKRILSIAVTLVAGVTLVWSGGSGESASTADATPPDADAGADAGTLRVVATTTIVGDVVRNVGGDAISIDVLMPRGENPHSFEPSPSSLRTLEEADVVFTNGLGLEESLLHDIEEIATGRTVAVSQGIPPLEYHGHDDGHDDGHGHAHGEGDPHVWTDPNNILVWVDNIVSALSEADPSNETLFRENARAYKDEIEALDRYIREQVGTIPPDERKLVLDHDSFAYFADEYGFELVGTIVPGTSDRSDPSAQDVARLVEVVREENVGVVFVGRTASRSMQRLAQTVADEVGREVRVVTLLTGSLSRVGEPGDTYIDFMRYNVQQILVGFGE